MSRLCQVNDRESLMRENQRTTIEGKSLCSSAIGTPMTLHGVRRFHDCRVHV